MSTDRSCCTQTRAPENVGERCGMDAVSLSIVAEEELEHARGASSCRSARTIHGGRDRVLRETVIALLAGHDLAEHESPGEATVQVLHGHVRLVSAGDAVDPDFREGCEPRVEKSGGGFASERDELEAA